MGAIAKFVIVRALFVAFAAVAVSIKIRQGSFPTPAPAPIVAIVDY